MGQPTLTKACYSSCTDTGVQAGATSCSGKSKAGLRLNIGCIFSNSRNCLGLLRPRVSRPAQTLGWQELRTFCDTQSVLSILPLSELLQEAGRAPAHFLPAHPCQSHTSQMFSCCQTRSYRRPPYHAHAAAHSPRSPGICHPETPSACCHLVLGFPLTKGLLFSLGHYFSILLF